MEVCNIDQKFWQYFCNLGTPISHKDTNRLTKVYCDGIQLDSDRSIEFRVPPPRP